MGSYLPSIKTNGELRKPPKADDNPIYSPVDNLVGYLPAIEPEQIPDPRHTKYADICVNSAKQAADDANLVKIISNEFNRKADDVLAKLADVDEQVERATTAANTATSEASVATAYANVSISKATEAITNALTAEGYSVGEQNGEPVEEGSPYYQHNAKYYAEQAAIKTATSIEYDGTSSGLDADNVQDAIDETITKVNSKADRSELDVKADKTEIPTIAVTPITTSGTHIADITVNGTKEELYVPDDIKNELWKRDRPYFVFIDDDGREEFKNLYTNILEPRNIKAGLSICFSDYILGAPGYLSVAELKDYEAQGNDILCHSTSIDTLIPSTAEAVLRYCTSQLRKYGFTNNGIFVYPNGNTGENRIAIESITSDYFNYGINVNYEHNCPVKIPIDNRFNIGRIFINTANLNTDAVKQYISDIIDDTFENNKLLIISTHSNKCDTVYLAEVLDTIINRGGIFESPVAVFKDLERTYIEARLDTLSDIVSSANDVLDIL